MKEIENLISQGWALISVTHNSISLTKGGQWKYFLNHD